MCIRDSIKVGGASEVEVKERKDRVDDALHATRAAVEEGIVPGGGTALLYATKALDGMSGVNEDQTRGIDIIRRALQAPVRQIAENAGFDGGVVAGKLFDQSDSNYGFNASTDVYEDPVSYTHLDVYKRQGYGTAIYLGFWTPLAGVGVWIGLAVGLVVVSAVLLLRWRMRGRLGLLPA